MSPVQARDASRGWRPEGVDEQRALQPFERVLRGEERDEDVTADIERKAPEERMHKRIPAFQVEQRFGLQEVDAEGAVGQEALHRAADANDARQKQRVGPDAETGDEPDDRSALGPAAPVDAADHRRQKLRGGRKRDEPDCGKRVGARADTIIEEAERQDQHDRKPPHGEEKPGQVALLMQLQPTAPEEQRHDDVIGDHDREGDAGDDHHRGRRGEAADERAEGKDLTPRLHRNRENVEIRIAVDADDAESRPPRSAR